ncbi:uncharacterized protein LOC120662502 [Panicum virgatum]|uniref:uncharacterized protein LOC120662502 n=1 Tax=Panicum virgatum TaxID=38727 RepID=UPI0019D5251D|nr:uncharacterized protein LOC120662502 [Panicum virgatum]
MGLPPPGPPWSSAACLRTRHGRRRAAPPHHDGSPRTPPRGKEVVAVDRIWLPRPAVSGARASEPAPTRLASRLAATGTRAGETAPPPVQGGEERREEESEGPPWTCREERRVRAAPCAGDWGARRGASEGGARSGAGEGVHWESRGCEEEDRRERGGGPPIYKKIKHLRALATRTATGGAAQQGWRALAVRGSWGAGSWWLLQDADSKERRL